jgi:regulator of replication initiation timing
MPSKNKKQLNFFLLVKAYKEYGEMGVFRQYKYLEGQKPKLTDEYMYKIIKTAENIKPADLIDLTSGTEVDNPVGDKKDLKAGYWALFRGKYKPKNSKDETHKEDEFVAMIKKVDNQKGVVNFNHNGFRNKFGQTMEIPKRANVSNPEFMFLDYALFDNIIRTGKTPQEVARERENLEEVRKIIRNILKENLEDNLEEGKLARMLGTAAIATASLFPSQVKSQNINKQNIPITQADTKEPMTTLSVTSNGDSPDLSLSRKIAIFNAKKEAINKAMGEKKVVNSKITNEKTIQKEDGTYSTTISMDVQLAAK